MDQYYEHDNTIYVNGVEIVVDDKNYMFLRELNDYQKEQLTEV